MTTTKNARTPAAPSLDAAWEVALADHLAAMRKGRPGPEWCCPNDLVRKHGWHPCRAQRFLRALGVECRPGRTEDGRRTNWYRVA